MPQVFIEGVAFDLPDALPIAGQRYRVVVHDKLEDNEGLNWANMDHANHIMNIVRKFPNREALFTTLDHELHEGLDHHFDLRLGHMRIAAQGEAGGAFWLAVVMAHDSGT